MPDDNETLVPVRLADGSIDFLPLDEDNTPTWLVVVKSAKAKCLSTSDPNGDRIMVGGVTVEEAVGRVLMDNPRLSYDDILDHMEV